MSYMGICPLLMYYSSAQVHLMLNILIIWPPESNAKARLVSSLESRLSVSLGSSPQLAGVFVGRIRYSRSSFVQIRKLVERKRYARL